MLPGHYAQVGWDTSHASPRPKLLRSNDTIKDQTYYLSSITESSLRKVSKPCLLSSGPDLTSPDWQSLFPIGHLTKTEIRTLAKRYNLPTASRSESMGICFVGEKGRFDRFLCMCSAFRHLHRLTSLTSQQITFLRHLETWWTSTARCSVVTKEYTTILSGKTPD